MRYRQQLTGAALGAVVILLFVFLCNDGTFAILIAALLLLGMFLRQLRKITRPVPAYAPGQLARRWIILGALAVCIAAPAYNHGHAQRKGEAIVQGVMAYHNSTGDYPESLLALVPEYLPAVPAAAVISGPPYREFSYSRHEEHPILLYVHSMGFT